MSYALIGHTGFVGSNLTRQHRFDAAFNSKNIEEIVGRAFDLLVCSGMPAAKWIANRDPAGDRANLMRLCRCLEQTTAERAVLISTVDVYPAPVGVDEDSPIDPEGQHPYGKHRLMLEQVFRSRFPAGVVVRLPGLFGNGLKKNAIFDLLHQNEIHKIHADSMFQFYNLDHLWSDIVKALAGLRLVNFATEPFTVADMAREAFGLMFDNRPDGSPARYEVRTKHAELFAGHHGFIYTREQVLRELRAFVNRERGAPT